jgi:hypothetical protein
VPWARCSAVSIISDAAWISTRGLVVVGFRPPRRHLRSVGNAFAAAQACLKLGQGGHEWADLLDDERALPGLRFDQVPGDEPFHGVTDGIPGRVVLFPELEFGGQPGAVAPSSPDRILCRRSSAIWRYMGPGI